MENTNDKMECSLSNEELIKRCHEWISKLCESGGKAWTLRVPADYNKDPDLLFTELADRLTSYDQMKEKECVATGRL